MSLENSQNSQVYEIVIKNLLTNSINTIEMIGKNPDDVRRKIKLKNQGVETLCIYPQEYSEEK